jgi:hypothetical protein
VGNPGFNHHHLIVRPGAQYFREAVLLKDFVDRREVSNDPRPAYILEWFQLPDTIQVFPFRIVYSRAEKLSKGRATA